MEENMVTKENIIEKSNIPGAKSALTLGIISIVTFCCCYGLVGLICGIIAFVKAGKAISLFDANPDKYLEKSLANAKTGRTCGLIGIILSAICIVLLIILLTSGSYEEMLREVTDKIKDQGFEF